MVLIKYLFNKTSLKRTLRHPFQFICNFYYLIILPDKISIKKDYKKIFGVYPDLKNPKTLNEKMQWLKLHDRTPLHTICADKFRSREYIKKKVGEQYLVPLVFATKDVKNINIDNLPDYPIAIKATHDCSGAEIIRDKTKVNYIKLQTKLKVLLNNNWYYQTKEWPYKNIKPRIVVEKLLTCKNGRIPNDYKFHCFNGKAKVVYVSIDREGINKRNIYSIDWKPLMFTWAWINKDTTNLRGNEIPKPENYERMIKIAEKLSEPFRYVRIDLYNVDAKIYCGEITFFHGGGLFIISPKEWDRKLGDMLDLKRSD